MHPLVQIEAPTDDCVRCTEAPTDDCVLCTVHYLLRGRGGPGQA